MKKDETHGVTFTCFCDLRWRDRMPLGTIIRDREDGDTVYTETSLDGVLWTIREAMRIRP